jgi:hypothetical protein
MRKRAIVLKFDANRPRAARRIRPKGDRESAILIERFTHLITVRPAAGRVLSAVIEKLLAKSA